VRIRLKKLSPIIGKLVRCPSGSPAIEFAVIAPVLISLIFGIVEWGRFFWLRTTIEQGVESAARYGVFQNKLYNEKVLADWVTPTSTYAQAALYGINNLTVTVVPDLVCKDATVNGSTKHINMVQVDATYTFSPILTGITWGVPKTVDVVASQAASQSAEGTEGSCT
jgi:Flp pilus assembly protein TadG